MSNTIGRAKILTAPCIFFKKRSAVPVWGGFRGGFRGGFSGQGGGKEGRDGRDGTGRAAGQDRAGQGGRERAGQSGGGADRSRASVEAGAETGGGKRTKKTGETRKNGKTGKNWKMLEKTGKSDRGLPGRRSGGTGRERHSAVKPRRYWSLKPSSSTSTGQYSRSSSRRKRTV